MNPQYQGRGAVEQVGSEVLDDAEKIASKILEAQVCVILAVPTGIFLLGFGIYELIVDFYLNVDTSSLETIIPLSSSDWLSWVPDYGSARRVSPSMCRLQGFSSAP